MNISRPSKELLQRYLASRCTDEERALVDSWYGSLDLGEGEPFTSSDEQRLFERIRSDISPAPVRKIRLGFLAKIAASIVLLAGLGTGGAYLVSSLQERHTSQFAGPPPHTVTYLNSGKQIHPYLLPDSSIVQLLPGAVITHPEQFPARKRTVSFRGEGFFSIARNENAPFVIESGNLRTEVLGTSFNLRANPESNAFSITVATGKVAVTLANEKNGSERIILTRNQQATVAPEHEKIVVASVPAKTQAKELWQPVSLVYEDTPLKEVAGQLQSVFNVPIELDNPSLGNCSVTVEFRNQNLPDVLSMLNVLLGISYEIKNDTIRITGDRCGG